jgi:hypothetical protein
MRATPDREAATMGTGMILDHIVDKYELHRPGDAVSRRQTIDPENGRANRLMSFDHFLAGEICSETAQAEGRILIVRGSSPASAVCRTIQSFNSGS